MQAGKRSVGFLIFTPPGPSRACVHMYICVCVRSMHYIGRFLSYSLKVYINVAMQLFPLQFKNRYFVYGCISPSVHVILPFSRPQAFSVSAYKLSLTQPFLCGVLGGRQVFRWSYWSESAHIKHSHVARLSSRSSVCTHRLSACFLVCVLTVVTISLSFFANLWTKLAYYCLYSEVEHFLSLIYLFIYLFTLSFLFSRLQDLLTFFLIGPQSCFTLKTQSMPPRFLLICRLS